MFEVFKTELTYKQTRYVLIFGRVWAWIPGFCFHLSYHDPLNSFDEGQFLVHIYFEQAHILALSIKLSHNSELGQGITGFLRYFRYFLRNGQLPDMIGSNPCIVASVHLFVMDVVLVAISSSLGWTYVVLMIDLHTCTESDGKYTCLVPCVISSKQAFVEVLRQVRCRRQQ